VDIGGGPRGTGILDRRQGQNFSDDQGLYPIEPSSESKHILRTRRYGVGKGYKSWKLQVKCLGISPPVTKKKQNGGKGGNVRKRPESKNSSEEYRRQWKERSKKKLNPAINKKRNDRHEGTKKKKREYVV